MTAYLIDVIFVCITKGILKESTYKDLRSVFVKVFIVVMRLLASKSILTLPVSIFLSASIELILLPDNYNTIRFEKTISLRSLISSG